MSYIAEATSTNYGIVDGFSTALNNLCYSMNNEGYYKTISMISRDSFRDQLNNPDIVYYIIFDNSGDGLLNVPCGYIKAKVKINRLGMNTTVIEELYISKAYRARGMGKALLNKITRWSENKGIRFIEVSIPSCLVDAFKYFSYLGFIEENTTMQRRIR